MVVVGAPDHPLARKHKVSLRNLTDASWVLREKGSGTRLVFEAALRARTIDTGTLRTILEPPTNEAVCAAVRSSTHLIVVSYLVARPHVEAGRVAPNPFNLGTRSFGIVRHRQRYRTKASVALEALLPACTKSKGVDRTRNHEGI